MCAVLEGPVATWRSRAAEDDSATLFLDVGLVGVYSTLVTFCTDLLGFLVDDLPRLKEKAPAEMGVGGGRLPFCSEPGGCADTGGILGPLDHL